ncbi:MAG: hypothetical protein MUC44_03470 [Beijerinckiaceae bacterium]|jgi:hypothetical protein|nr:hypothetical protein [Beijerinckiaceae bacterium]
MARSEQYTQGYRAAIKDAVTLLHRLAASKGDEKAVAILNVAAFDLGHQAKRWGEAGVDAPQPFTEEERTELRELMLAIVRRNFTDADKPNRA